MNRLSTVFTGALTVGLAAALWAVGHGAGGLAYLAVYAGVVLPGLPLGFRLFGRSHPAAWISGAAIGYALAILVCWGTTALGAASAPGFIAGISLSTFITWAVTRDRPAAVHLPDWSRSATASLAAVLLVTLALAALPLARVGERDVDGNIRYRAYFTADFAWHAALTSELTRFSLPPRNPYLAPAPIHYYWGYFVVPAAIAEYGPPPLRNVERCLRLNALLTGLLLISSIFMAAFAAVRQPVAAGVGTALALGASSLEGTYALWRIWSRHAPLAALRDMNIDALTAWYFQGHRIDGLQRCLWYVPQHSMAYALGLTALTVAAVTGSEASLEGIVLVGVALGGATILNPFVGAAFAAAWGAAVAIQTVRQRHHIASTLGRHAAATVPVLLAVAWCVINGMVEGAGSTLEFGLDGASRTAPVVSLLLSCGPVLIAAAAGLLVVAATPRATILPAALLAVLSLVLMFFVRLSVDHEWIPFRAGHMLFVAGAVLAARWFAAPVTALARRTVIAAAALLFIAGMPTTIIDAYNAQDVRNLHTAPGFHWTLLLSPDQQQAFQWIRTRTSRNAVVQMEPIVRERDSWSLIPSFAQRPMAAGLPISLLRIPEYRARSEQVKTLFETAEPREASAIAHTLHIRFLYVDATDRAAYAGAAKFDSSPRYFDPVFRQGDVGVYEVK